MRTVTLSGKPPIQVDEAEWALVASYDASDFSWVGSVRRHRTTCEVLVTASPAALPGAGYLLPPCRDDSAKLARYIQCVADETGRPELGQALRDALPKKPNRPPGRPPLDPDEKRTESVRVQLNASEKRKIAENARGEPLAVFLRRRGLVVGD